MDFQNLHTVDQKFCIIPYFCQLAQLPPEAYGRSETSTTMSRVIHAFGEGVWANVRGCPRGAGRCGSLGSGGRRRGLARGGSRRAPPPRPRGPGGGAGRNTYPGSPLPQHKRIFRIGWEVIGNEPPPPQPNPTQLGGGTANRDRWEQRMKRGGSPFPSH